MRAIREAKPGSIAAYILKAARHRYVTERTAMNVSGHVFDTASWRCWKCGNYSASDEASRKCTGALAASGALPHNVYNSTDAVCPWCKHHHEDAWKLVSGVLPQPMVCEKCAKPFAVDAEREVTYITRPLPE
jgi:transposase-like protein